LRVARRGRAELSGSGRGARHLHRYGHEPPGLRPAEIAGVPGATGQVMRHPKDVDGPTPDPGELAGYVDGELDAAGCRRVEAWLAAHPEAATEVEGQRRLAGLWRA